jgi:hypothetical protein
MGKRRRRGERHDPVLYGEATRLLQRAWMDLAAARGSASMVEATSDEDLVGTFAAAALEMLEPFLWALAAGRGFSRRGRADILAGAEADFPPEVLARIEARYRERRQLIALGEERT